HTTLFRSGCQFGHSCRGASQLAVAQRAVGEPQRLGVVRLLELRDQRLRRALHSHLHLTNILPPKSGPGGLTTFASRQYPVKRWLPGRLAPAGEFVALPTFRRASSSQQPGTDIRSASGCWVRSVRFLHPHGVSPRGARGSPASDGKWLLVDGAVLGWLLATMGTAALGSVFPLVNIELYLLGVVSSVNSVSWWALAVAAAFGQLIGKTLFFFAGRGSFRLGERLMRKTDTSNSRWTEWLHSFHRRTEERPLWGTLVLFATSIPGIPPFTLMCFLSGAAGLPLLTFWIACLAGRTLHFFLITGAPELLSLLPAGG